MGTAITKNWIVDVEDDDELTIEYDQTQDISTTSTLPSTTPSSTSTTRQRRFTIQLRHNTFTGHRRVEVNGRMVIDKIKFIDDGEEIVIQLTSTKTATVRIIVSNFLFSYELTVDGKEIKDITAENKSYVDLDYRLSVPSYDIKTIDYKKVVIYNIQMSMDGNTYTVARRFNQFAELDKKIRSAFAGNHLRDNLPSLPTREVKLFVDHYSHDFINTRRERLEQYMKALLQIPKVGENPDFLAFLKQDAVLRQTEKQI